MIQGERRKGTAGKGAFDDRDARIRLAPKVILIHEAIVESVCEEVFEDQGIDEWKGKWVRFALARLWRAVILDPPPSLYAPVERTRDGHDSRGFLRDVDAESEAFFQRCRDLSGVCFAWLCHSCIVLALPQSTMEWVRDLGHMEKEFSDALILDGSRFDEIAHKPKILWQEKAVVLSWFLLAV